MGRSVLGCCGNGAMHSPLGSTVRLPLFSPIANNWSDMWIVDELMYQGAGCEPGAARVETREYERTSLMA